MATGSRNCEVRERFVEIPVGKRKVKGILSMPPVTRGVVAFAHGSGSGRFSPRNQFVAELLQDAGLGTLLIDLLEEDETRDRRNVFDIELLAKRLGAATDWLDQDLDTRGLSLGYFGASTGAAAALVAAARSPESVDAIVSRGGRPDLAWGNLPDVIAPTLLIVGGRDQEVHELNLRAQMMLGCANELAVVPGATHLFEEAGALEQVAHLAKQWFLRHLGTASRARHDPSTVRMVGPSVHDQPKTRSEGS